MKTPTPTRVQITTNKYDKENAENHTQAVYGLSLNQYLSMLINSVANQYLNDNDDTVSPELQAEIDETVSGTTNLINYDSSDDVAKDLGINIA